MSWLNFDIDDLYHLPARVIELVKREISKNPDLPYLNDMAKVLLSKLCFMPNHVEKADIIFVFGSPYGMAENVTTIHELLDKDISHKVIITGGNPKFDDIEVMSESESQRLVRQINTKAYPHVAFYTENKSHHTLANVTEAMEILDFNEFKSVLFVTKSFASRRGYLSLRQHLPEHKIMCRSYGSIYPDCSIITKNTWHKFEEGKKRIWGEFLRIKKYGERGDFNIMELESLIKKIEREVKI